jgi:probable phosphoglycerate mutase
MFNTIGRAQGWSDTPLTPAGELGIHGTGRGFYEANMDFVAAFSSDSGRTIQTMDILLDELHQPKIPYLRDKRIREWCFGSLDGGFDGMLFEGVLPRTSAYAGKDMENLTYEDMANGIVEVDTANWAEPWDVLKNRIYSGFEDMAHRVRQNGGGNALVVSHGMTIGTFCNLVHPDRPRPRGILNGSVTVVSYDDSGFTVEKIGDISYQETGLTLLEND